MSSKIWHIADRLAEDVVEHLLLSRGLSTPEQQKAFLNPSLSDLSSLNSFFGLDDAVSRIIEAIDKQESIVVWGDFDADGVTSTAIMWETLHELGGKVMPYIPSRDTEGHGFSEIGIQKLIDDGVKLVITVDHGITAIDEVGFLNEAGIEVIVTDHHEPKLRLEEKIDQQAEEFNLPEAVAVIHPLLMDTPQPLAGCGVAYHLAYAVWLAHKNKISSKTMQELAKYDSLSAREEFATTKIELAGIGTIADMVPLLGDNRVLAAFGLQALVQTDRPGLHRMYQLAGLTDKTDFGTYDVGFLIGPRLNAPGRLADALESLRLLCVKSKAKAAELARDLDDLNKQRQDLLVEVTNEAKAEVLKHEDGVYVLAKPNWPAGVCGLAAGKIVEMYHRPAVVMEQMGELSRGSARSIKGFDFTAALTQISDLLESFGGHAMAAGFVAQTSKLQEIEQRLSQLLWQQFKPEDLKPQLHIDAEVDLPQLNWEFYSALQQLEPCGMGNPKPIFILKNVQIVNHRAVGGEGKHLKVTVAGNRSSGAAKVENLDLPQLIDGIAFNLGFWSDKIQPDQNVDIAFSLDENVWNGKKSLQLLVKDIRESPNT